MVFFVNSILLRHRQSGAQHDCAAKMDLHHRGRRPAELEIPLTTGWNLVSLPLIQPYTIITEVLSSLEPDYNLVYAYDGSSGGWHKYDFNAPEYANTLSDLDRTLGF